MLRNFLRDDDITSEEQAQILKLAQEFKADRFSKSDFLRNKTIAIVFDKTSTRTRVSFTVGVNDLGGFPMVIDSKSSQISKQESIADTTRVLDRQVEAIIWRTYDHNNLTEMAEHSKVPVINALSDDFHPCQILADIQTIIEHKGSTLGLKAVFLGDTASNMAHSYLLGFATAGINIIVSGPQKYAPNSDYLLKAQAIAHARGSQAIFMPDAHKAVADADIVITDTWVSMGQENEYEERKTIFSDYQVNIELMSKAKNDAIFMHCLPAYRGSEVTSDVIDGSQSVVWDQAENRLHAQKALTYWLLSKS